MASQVASDVGSPQPLDRPIFIVGHARAGSTLLAAVLARHPDIGPKPPPDALLRNDGLESLLRFDAHLRYASQLERKDVWFEHCGGRDVFTHMGLELVREESFASQVDRPLLLEQLTRGFTQLRFMSKAPTNTFRMRLIAALFPGAKFVVLYRNGEEVVGSWGRRPYGFGRRVNWGELRTWRLGYKRGIDVFSRKWEETILYAESCRDSVAMERLTYRQLVSEPARLFAELVKWRLWPIPFNREDLEGSRAPVGKPPSLAAGEAAVYELCIRHEMLPDELAAAIRASDSVAVEYRMALETARCREQAFEELATRLRCRAVAYMQGYTPIAAAMRAVALRRGVGLVALENTLFNDRVTWDGDTGIACFTSRSRAAYRRHAEDPGAEATGSGTRHMQGILGNLKSEEHKSGSERCQVDGPYVLFVGQVFTDAAIVFGSQPGWGPLQVVAHVRRRLAGSGVSLVVKAHPKESGGSDPVLGRPYERLFTRRLRMSFPDIMAASDCIIDVDNRMDTYAMIRSASCVVTMNSQAGIEAAALGVPTIVCARAYYGDCGFTFDGSAPDKLVRSLETCLALTPDERSGRQRKAMEFAEILRYTVFVPRTSKAIAELIARAARSGVPQGRFS